MRPTPIYKRVDSLIASVPMSGCWLWLGNLTHDGYPIFASAEGKTVYVHRHVYEREIGKIPSGLTLDHLCRVRCCVNPTHMDPVTLRENIARGNYGWRKEQTHCKNGHEFTPENTIYRHVGESNMLRRECRECGRIAQRAYQRRKREAMAA